jgi:signal peptidase I
MADTKAAETKPTDTRPPEPKPTHGFKETISSLIVAFVFAFVFRGFVVEAFVIPTGSMGPTLMGKHTRYQSPESGYTWSVDPTQVAGGSIVGVGANPSTMTATDPMTGARIGEQLPEELGRNQKLLSGDRIFVLKYLYSLYDPSRYDVVVFKYPGRPASDMLVGQQENYIKRLIGLPGEEIALVDGDVFRRPAPGQPGALVQSDWSDAGWEIARKTERTQRALWQPVYNSDFAPRNPDRDLRRWFENPWRGRTADGAADPAWDTEGRSYTYTGSTPTTLEWDNDARPITDRYAYNERPGGRFQEFAVSDVRMAMGVEPTQAGLTIGAVLETRGHQFRAEIGAGRITIKLRPLAGDQPGEWRTLAETQTEHAFEPGTVTNVEFWHADQSVQVWIEGELVAEGAYAWSPAARIEHTLGASADELLRPTDHGNPLANERLYPQPRLRWEFAGSPVTLHRVRLDRDLFYRPGVYNPDFARGDQPSLGTHPSQPNLLGPDQFFVCGDNSPNSLDGRLWDRPDPWVYQTIDPTIGIVPRELLIGKAFFVYFPSLHKAKKIPIPDVGRMRFIW